MKHSNALAGICLGVVMALSLSSCTSYKGDLSTIVSTKTLVVGTNAEYSPFEYTNSAGKIMGFDVDFMDLVAKSLGTKYNTTISITWKNMNFDGLIGSLQGNQIDCIAAAFSITDERAKSVLFSDSYFSASTVVVTSSTNTTITDMDSLKTSNCGAQLGTVQAGYIQADGWNTKNKALASISDLILAIQSNTLDALVVEKPVAESIIAKQTGLKMIDTIKFDDGGYGIASNKDTGTDLIAAINEVIKTNTDNGVLDQLYIDAANEASGNQSVKCFSYLIHQTSVRFLMLLLNSCGVFQSLSAFLQEQ